MKPLTEQKLAVALLMLDNLRKEEPEEHAAAVRFLLHRLANERLAPNAEGWVTSRSWLGVSSCDKEICAECRQVIAAGTYSMHDPSDDTRLHFQCFIDTKQRENEVRLQARMRLAAAASAPKAET